MDAGPGLWTLHEVDCARCWCTFLFAGHGKGWGRAWLEDGAGRARVGTVEARKRDISSRFETFNDR